MSIPTLIVGGIEIPLRAFVDGFEQDYEELAGIAPMRMASGALLIQRNWPAQDLNYKLRTTISGGGRLPAPLDALDRSLAHEIQCAQHRHSAAPGTVVPVPERRRSGGLYSPRGYALVAGELVETTIALAGAVATLGAVPGAQHYQVRYWPKFTAYITHRASGEPWRARRSWVLVMEEV